MPQFRPRPRQYKGPCFVTKDNIDTDQIIPAEYLTLVPSKVSSAQIPQPPFWNLVRSSSQTPSHSLCCGWQADEYEQLGSHALCGLPDNLYPTRFGR